MSCFTDILVALSSDCNMHIHTTHTHNIQCIHVCAHAHKIKRIHISKRWSILMYDNVFFLMVTHVCVDRVIE